MSTLIKDTLLNDVDETKDLTNQNELVNIDYICNYFSLKNHDHSELKKFSDSLLPVPIPYLTILDTFFHANINLFHVESYRMLLQEHIPSIIYSNGTFTTLLDSIRYTLKFSNVDIKFSDPSVNFCHQHGIHYTCDIFAQATLSSEFEDKMSRHPPLTLKRHPPHTQHLLLARLVLMTGVDENSDYDLIGVIIVRGKVRTCPAVKTALQDYDIVYLGKDSTVLSFRSTHRDKIFRATSTMELNIRNQVKNPKLGGLISVKLPFATKDIHISIIAKCLNCSAKDFFHLVKTVSGSLYMEHKFNSYKVSMFQNEPESQDESFILVAKLYKRKTIQTGQFQIQNELFPHLKNKNHDKEVRRKIFLLALLTSRIILTHERLIPVSSRDAWSMSQVVTSANHIGALFRTQFIASTRQSGKTLRRKLMDHDATNSEDLSKIDLEIVVCEKRISDRTASAAATGIWSQKRNGVTISLNTANDDAMQLQLRQIYSPLKQTNGAHEEARASTDDQYGFICPAYSPDGPDTGLVSEIAMTARITPPIPQEMSELISTLIIAHSGDNLMDMDDYYDDPFPLGPKQRFLMNIAGEYTHIIQDVNEFIKMFHRLRRSSTLDRFIFIADFNPRFILLCREGLLARPLIIASRLKDITSTISFEECISQGIIEYVSCQEQLTLTKVAMVEAEMTPQTTHVELMQSAFLGLMAGSVFFANCQQSGRLTLICTQFKQTIRAIMSKDRGQQSSAHLYYAFCDLVTTKSATLRPSSEVGRGTPGIVAILADREPQEDSIKVGKGPVERGFLLAGTRISYMSEAIIPKNPTNTMEKFEKPNYAWSKKIHSYDALDEETGIVPKGTQIEDEQILIGKTQTVAKTPYDNNNSRIHSVINGATTNGKSASFQTQMKRCISTSARRGHPGQVVESTISTQPSGQRAKVTVEKTCFFKLGDKLNTDAAMKGVAACITPQENMPFSELTGICPDVIFQPLGPFSRMTPSFIMAGITGKAICTTAELLHGIDQQNLNETREQHMQNMGDLLVKSGYERNGREMMICGMTGEELGFAEIFVLTIQRLNHLCESKVHFRSTGSVDPKTRQPKDGRKNGSGARNSHMEATVFQAYGVSEITQQRFCDLSDRFTVYICKDCSLFVDDLGTDIGFAWCRRCATETSVRKVKLSFMLLVLLYYLNALGIATWLDVKDAKTMFVRPV